MKYVYLGDYDILSIIISFSLNAEQGKISVAMLANYKKAIGWTMIYIKRIGPTICMCKFLLKDCYSNLVK